MAEVIWTPSADDDITSIIDYFSPRSEKYAKILIQNIFDKTTMLETLPRIGRVVPELEYKNVREILVGNYRIVYHIVSENRIDILAVHHSSRALDIRDL